MGKIITAVVFTFVLWVAFCEGRYYEQTQGNEPAISAPAQKKKPKPAVDDGDLTLGQLIEKAERDAALYHLRKATKKVDNNAGNLRDKAGNFQTFATPKAGYVALEKDIKIKLSGKSPAMKAKLGAKYKPTLKNVLHVYAPPHENNTKNYIKFVAKKAKISPDKVLTVADANRIIPHIITMEKGSKKAKIFTQYAKR